MMLQKRKIQTRYIALLFVFVFLVEAIFVWGVYRDIGFTLQDEVAKTQEKNIALAAQIFARFYPNSKLHFEKDGQDLDFIEISNIPEFFDNQIVDMIGKITGETATVFVWDSETRDFWRKTTNILKDDGTRAIGTPLGQEGKVYPVIMSGKSYKGEAVILGKSYFTYYTPIFKTDTSEILGILYVGLANVDFHKLVWEHSRDIIIQTIILGGALLGITLFFMFYIRIARLEGHNALKEGQKKEILFQSIIESMPAVVFCKDVQNDYRYNYVNKSAEEFFGVKAEFILGKTDHEYFNKEEADFFCDIDKSVIASGEVLDIPCEQVTTANSTMLVHTKKVPIYDDNGKPVLLLGVAEDITLKKRNELELQEYRDHLEQMVSDRTEKLEVAKKKAEELNHLKSDFLATMSHEIRTPMNGILGMAELIQGAKPSSQIDGYARMIISSGEVLQQIIDDILDFSKIEAGKLELESMAVDLQYLVDDVATLHAVKARDKAIELVEWYKPGSEQFVFTDPVRLRQVLGNLISNAIKFTDTGYIAITVEDVSAPELPKDKVQMKFSVTDTGIGMSEEAQGKIFEKFQQADTSTTRRYGGTGLGLSICKSLVELMGGTIGIESEEGKGSTFWFVIEMQRNTSVKHVLPDITVLKDTRILIVDDLPIIRQLISEQLLSLNIRCDTAASGEEALKMIMSAKKANDPYSIGIIDYLMPQMNGEMLSTAINDDQDLKEICLIMLTAAGNPLGDDNFAEKGFSAYIPKPIHNKALIESLAIVWSQYQKGVRDKLIHVDTASLGKDTEIIEQGELEGVKILVAEDNLVNQVFIKQILETMKADYTLVSNGQEAVDAVQAQVFELILMDCLMPQMDGFDATRAIRVLEKEGKIAPIRICALTANAMKGDRDKCIASGMDEYLSKPVRRKDLKDKVISLIDRLQAQGDSSTQDKISEANNKVTSDKPNVVYINASEKPSPEDLKSVVSKDDETLDSEAVENARSILKDKYDEMVNVYISSGWECVEEIVKAIESNDVEAIIRPSHTLKSTSKQMGAMKLASIAKSLEYCAKAIHKGEAEEYQNFELMAKKLNDIKTVLAETKIAFEKIAS